jgi:hypothetical protein
MKYTKEQMEKALKTYIGNGNKTEGIEGLILEVLLEHYIEPDLVDDEEGAVSDIFKRVFSLMFIDGGEVGSDSPIEEFCSEFEYYAERQMAKRVFRRFGLDDGCAYSFMNEDMEVWAGDGTPESTVEKYKEYVEHLKQ